MARRKLRQTRAEPTRQPLMAYWLESSDIFCSGYTRLIDNPEVHMAIERIAELISSMTIHLMANGKNGDERIKNELSKKIDVNPCRGMTRRTWMHWIVKTMLINGNAYVFPKTQGGILQDLVPMPGAYMEQGFVYYNNAKYDPDELLHFMVNPDLYNPWIGEGYKVVLKDVVTNLKQATKTTGEFMGSKMLPSLIVKVDALTAELANKEGQEGVKDKYLASAQAGQPWIIPAELIDVQQVKPLTLNDIAIKDTVNLDKRTVAGILGVPGYLLGVGEFKKDEHNNFIRSRIMTISKGIEQELTRQLLLSPNWYWRLNAKSLFAYDTKEIATMYSELYVRGLAIGNEVRDAVGLSPMDGLDKLVILENYIPLDKIAEQKKLEGGDGGA